MKKFAALTSVALLASCVAAGPQRPPFSGNPIVSIKAIDPQEAASMFASVCNQKGGRIVSESAHALTCATPMESSAGYAYNVVSGGGRSATNPDQVIQISWIVSGDSLLVSAVGWLEYQTSSGQTKRDFWDEYDDAKKYQAQDLLEHAKRMHEAAQ